MRLADAETGELLRVGCKGWGCPLCAPRKRRELIRRLQVGLEQPEAIAAATRPRFLTLTCPPGESFAISCRRLSRRFEQLRRIVERATGRRVEFIAVVERGSRGQHRVHLHVVFRGPWVPQATWSTWAVRAGFGPIVDIRQVKSGDLARYASKSLGGYITKAASTAWPAHFRRVRVSRGWAPGWTVYRPARTGRWVLVSVDPLEDVQQAVERLVACARGSPASSNQLEVKHAEVVAA